MIAATESLARMTGMTTACAALGVPRSTVYRAGRPLSPPVVRPTPLPAQRRALSPAERETVRTTLNSPLFEDCAVREVYAALLEQDTYLCSVATMYRILRANHEVTRVPPHPTAGLTRPNRPTFHRLPFAYCHFH